MKFKNAIEALEGKTEKIPQLTEEKDKREKMREKSTKLKGLLQEMQHLNNSEY